MEGREQIRLDAEQRRRAGELFVEMAQSQDLMDYACEIIFMRDKIRKQAEFQERAGAKVMPSQMETPRDLTFDYRIAKLALRKGDILIVKLAGAEQMTQVDIQNFQKYLRQHVGGNQAVLVLGSGTDIAVLTREQIEERVG
jgi:hypothetical protein